MKLRLLPQHAIKKRDRRGLESPRSSWGVVNSMHRRNQLATDNEKQVHTSQGYKHAIRNPPVPLTATFRILVLPFKFSRCILFHAFSRQHRTLSRLSSSITRAVAQSPFFLKYVVCNYTYTDIYAVYNIEKKQRGNRLITQVFRVFSTSAIVHTLC